MSRKRQIGTEWEADTWAGSLGCDARCLQALPWGHQKNVDLGVGF